MCQITRLIEIHRYFYDIVEDNQKLSKKTRPHMLRRRGKKPHRLRKS